VTTQKKIIVLSNWKMHKMHKEALDWIESLGKGTSELTEMIELKVWGSAPAVWIFKTF